MDYKALLIKYIQHVGECEGVTFISERYRGLPYPGFTDEEFNELQVLDRGEDTAESS